MQCVILAGGLGTRMWPEARPCPRPCCRSPGGPSPTGSSAGWPTAGVDLGRLLHRLPRRAGRASTSATAPAWGLDVRYVDEGRELRGTGGRPALALDAGCAGRALPGALRRLLAAGRPGGGVRRPRDALRTAGADDRLPQRRPVRRQQRRLRRRPGASATRRAWTRSRRRDALDRLRPVRPRPATSSPSGSRPDGRRPRAALHRPGRRGAARRLPRDRPVLRDRLALGAGRG